MNKKREWKPALKNNFIVSIMIFLCVSLAVVSAEDIIVREGNIDAVSLNISGNASALSFIGSGKYLTDLPGLNLFNQALNTTSNVTFNSIHTPGEFQSTLIGFSTDLGGQASSYDGAMVYLTDGYPSGTLQGNVDSGIKRGLYGNFFSQYGFDTSSDGNSVNWKQAYDWGNHATQGYFKTSSSDTCIVSIDFGSQSYTTTSCITSVWY